MKPLPLNLNALLYNKCKYAILESPTFTDRPKTPTQKEGDSSELVANTEFVSIVEAKLNARIDALEAKLNREVARLDGRIDSCEKEISSLKSRINDINSSLDSLNNYLQSLELRVSNIENSIE